MKKKIFFAKQVIFQIKRYFNLLKRYCFQYNRFSFSQLGEDRIIDYIFSAKKINKPFYIDIGAFHPWNLSNTALFYLQGANGITIEPNETNWKLFKRYRKRDINLNIGINSISGKLKYYKYNIGVFNTFSENEVENYKKNDELFLQEVKEIDVLTFNEVIKKYAPNRKIDLLSVDVEGLDYQILQSIDFEKYKPNVMCIETVSHNPEKLEKSNKIRTLLEGNGYYLYASTFFNDIFVATDFWDFKK